MSTFIEIKRATKSGDAKKVTEMTQKAINEGFDGEQIINECFIPAMESVGEDFATSKIYLPEMLIAARAMKTGLEIVKPYLVGEKVNTFAKVVVGTVHGDLHDIGKNIIGMMLEGSGMDLVDLGIDISPESFAAAVKTHKPEVVGLSALLSNTLPSMKKTIETIEEAGIRQNVKIIIGGAPVTKSYADEIGADAYCEGPSEAISWIKKNL